MKKKLFVVLEGLFDGLSMVCVGLMFCFFSADMFGLRMDPSSSLYDSSIASMDPWFVSFGFGLFGLLFVLARCYFIRSLKSLDSENSSI